VRNNCATERGEWLRTRVVAREGASSNPAAPTNSRLTPTFESGRAYKPQLVDAG
jgi:hypothetical protein